jgi:hypothetical protein
LSGPCHSHHPRHCLSSFLVLSVDSIGVLGCLGISVVQPSFWFMSSIVPALFFIVVVLQTQIPFPRHQRVLMLILRSRRSPLPLCPVLWERHLNWC